MEMEKSTVQAAFCSSVPPTNNCKLLAQATGNENNQHTANTPFITTCAHTKPSYKKRTDYLSWEDFFMAVASLSSQRSKDPVAPMGACIVNQGKVVIGIGYNGFPRGCSDDLLPWKANSDETSTLLSPSFFAVNAIINAILNKGSADVAGATLYTTSFPCHESAKIIIQSNIREVVYMAQDDNTSSDHVLPESDSLRASRIMLTMAKVNLRKHLPTKRSIRLNLTTGPLQLATASLEPSSTKPVSPPLDATTVRDLLIKEANYDPTQISSMKRLDYLSWDDYFMSVAFLTAQRSKDPNTQVGACIVDPQQRIVGLGYNGFPIGCSDDDLPWGRTGSSQLDKKYAFVCHAEVNAILNKCSNNVHGCKLYVALFPCNECAKIIIQSGISKVLYLRDTYHDTDSCRASRIMFQMAGVELVQLSPTQTTIDIQLMAKSATGHNE